MSLSILVLAVAGLALVLLLISLWLLWSVAPFFEWLKALSGIGLLLLAMGVGAAAWELQRYVPVAGIEPVASVSVSQLSGKQHWRVTVFAGQGQELSRELTGNLWQLEGNLLAVQPWSQALPLRPMLRPLRLTGRHLTLDSPRTEPASGQGLKNDWQTFSSYVLYPLYRPEMATPVIAPLRDGAVYDLWVSNNQLVVEPANGEAERAWQSWE